MVSDLYLGNPDTGIEDIAGMKPVHFRIQGYVLDHVVPIRFSEQPLSLIGTFVTLPIISLRYGKEFSGDQLVLPIVSPANNDRVTLIDLVEKQRISSGSVLQVTIHRDDDFAHGMIYAGGHGWCLSKVSAKADYLEIRAFAGDRLRQLKGVVRAAIVDEEDFAFQIQTIHELTILVRREGVRSPPH